MTPYRFRASSAAAVFAILAFAVLAFGTVDTWALTVFEISTFLLAACWAFRIATTNLKLVWNPFYLPVGLAALWTFLQAQLGLSADPYRTGGQALKWLALWLLMVIASQVFSDESIRGAFQAAMIWFGAGLCLFGMVQYFTAREMIYWSIPATGGRVFGPFVNANHFTALMELIIPSALLMAMRRSEKRLIYIVASSVILAAIVVCGSRAGIVVVAIECLIVLAVIAWTRRKAARTRQALWPVAGLAAAVALSFLVSGSRAVIERFDEPQAYSVRWSVARATWKLFLSRPWTGFGAGTFDQVYPSAAPFDLGLFWPHAHNDPVQFAMEWGAPGLLILAWILWLLLARRWRRDTWLTVILPSVAVLAHSWFDFPLQITAVTALWVVTQSEANPVAPQPLQNAGRRASTKGRARTRLPEPVKSAV